VTARSQGTVLHMCRCTMPSHMHMHGCPSVWALGLRCVVEGVHGEGRRCDGRCFGAAVERALQRRDSRAPHCKRLLLPIARGCLSCERLPLPWPRPHVHSFRPAGRTSPDAGACGLAMLGSRVALQWFRSRCDSGVPGTPGGQAGPCVTVTAARGAAAGVCDVRGACHGHGHGEEPHACGDCDATPPDRHAMYGFSASRAATF